MPEMRAIPKDHPLFVTWEAYKLTDDYANSKNWALRIRPMLQEGDPQEDFTIMPFDQREQLVEGSLWAAFMAGYAAAGGNITA